MHYVLDIGANVGDTTIAALISYPDAHVICFEPVTSTYKILSERVWDYKDRVILNQFALSSSAGECEINLTSHNGANSILSQAEWHKELNPHVKESGKEFIQMKRLDDIYLSFPSNYFEVVKIDVEGFELHVIEGGRAFFENCVGYILIEIAFMRDDSFDDQAVFKIFALLKELGYALINVFSVHNTPAASGGLMIAQFDCVFKKIKN